MVAEIQPAAPQDVTAVCDLLTQLLLPTDGLRECAGTLLVAKHGGHVIGSAAIEPYDDGALLRSVAVGLDYQCSGIGRALVEAALDLAWSCGARRVFLLTTTAEPYFAKRGFERITRQEVPPGVRTSVEFTAACPASATVMRKHF